MARSRKGYRRGGYNYTPRRAQALKKAQAISARKRRIRYAGAAAGGILGVAGAAYLGHRHGGKAVTAVRNFSPGMANIRNKMAARLVVDPKRKEFTRTVVPRIHESEVQRLRDKVDRAKLPPHLGGPDYRKYNQDNSVDTQSMTNRRVAGTLRAARRKTQGKRTKSKARVPAALKQRGGRTNVQQAALAQWIKDYG